MKPAILLRGPVTEDSLDHAWREIEYYKKRDESDIVLIIDSQGGNGTKAIEYLKKKYKFHHLDFEDIQSETQNPKLDIYKNYLFLILQFPQWKFSSKKIVPHEVDIFAGENQLSEAKINSLLSSLNANYSKIKKTLGWQPTYSIKKTASQMLSWYRSILK